MCVLLSFFLLCKRFRDWKFRSWNVYMFHDSTFHYFWNAVNTFETSFSFSENDVSRKFKKRFTDSPGIFFLPPPAMPKHLGSWVIWPMGHVLGHFLGHFLGQFSGSLFGTVFFVVFKLPKPYMPYMYCRHLKPQMRFCNCKYFKKIHTFFRSLLYT